MSHWDHLKAACHRFDGIWTWCGETGPRVLSADDVGTLDRSRDTTLIGTCGAGHRLRVQAQLLGDWMTPDRAVRLAGVVLRWGMVQPPSPRAKRLRGVLVPCPHCPADTEHLAVLQELRGTFDATKACTAACRRAYRPKCVCECGGVNHGMDYLDTADEAP